VRAYIFSIVGTFLLAGCFVAEPLSTPAVATQPATTPNVVTPPATEISPHAEALQLVFTKAAKKIREVELAFAKAAKAAEPKLRGDDEEFWWHDVAKREWTVRRSAYPGFIDSTHHLNVDYRIDGKVVASWFVDTRGGTIQEPMTGNAPTGSEK
jgi:hypothetical protein